MNRLRELRKEKKLTLKEVSSQLEQNNLKISPDALAKYERGDREPKLETWQKLADFFGVSVPYLQGISDLKGLTYSKDDVIKLINDTYVHEKEKDLDIISGNIDQYLKLKKIELPLNKFSINELKKLDKNVKKYWMNNFSFIFNSDNDVSINLHWTKSLEMNENLKNRVNEAIEKEILELTSTPISKLFSGLPENELNFFIQNKDYLLRNGNKESITKYILELITSFDVFLDKMKDLPENKSAETMRTYMEILKSRYMKD